MDETSWKIVFLLIKILIFILVQYLLGQTEKLGEAIRQVSLALSEEQKPKNPKTQNVRKDYGKRKINHMHLSMKPHYQNW